MANLQSLVPDDNPLDEQLQDGLPVREAGLAQAGADPLTEARQLHQHGLPTGTFLPQLPQLFALGHQGASPLLQQRAALGQFVQGEDAGLVRIQQPALFPSQALEADLELLRLGLLLLIAREAQLSEALELGQQLAGLTEQAGEMVPDRGFQLLGLDRAVRAAVRAPARDGILPGTAGVAVLRMGRGGRVGDAVHRQPTGATGEQTAQQVAMPGGMAEGQHPIAGELGLR
jgi:hypothetical protein